MLGVVALVDENTREWLMKAIWEGHKAWHKHIVGVQGDNRSSMSSHGVFHCRYRRRSSCLSESNIGLMVQRHFITQQPFPPHPFPFPISLLQHLCHPQPPHHPRNSKSELPTPHFHTSNHHSSPMHRRSNLEPDSTHHLMTTNPRIPYPWTFGSAA